MARIARSSDSPKLYRHGVGKIFAWEVVTKPAVQKFWIHAEDEIELLYAWILHTDYLLTAHVC
jgi:hypothetical protein